MTVLPLWCVSTLLAYLLCQTLLGPKRGFASLVMLGGFASAALLAIVGHPLPGIIVGGVSGGLSGAFLVRWTGMLKWRSVEETLSAAPSSSASAEVATAREPKPEPKPEPKASASQRSETPSARAASARTGSQSAAKSGKKSKRKKKKKKAAAAKASMEEASEVPVGRMLEETLDAVGQTAALGTVSRAGKTVAGFDAPTAVVDASSARQRALRAASESPDAPEEVAERLGRRPSSIPRGVFAMDDETPIALTLAKTPSSPARDPRAELTISGFADPTENLDGEIAPTHCPRCRAECAPEARYCAGCSAPVMPWSCKECGHENHAEADFCVRCQAPVELLASPVDVEILNE